MSIITTLSLLFGTLGSADYVRQTGLKEAIEASVNRDKITSTSYIGKADGEAWFPEKEYRIEDHVILKKKIKTLLFSTLQTSIFRTTITARGMLLREQPQ